MWCRGWMGHQEHCCIGPISFWWFLAPFYTTTCLLKFWFFRNCLSIEIQNLCNWIQHALNPKYAPLKTILMYFSQSKSTKHEIFACLLNSPWPTKKKINKKCHFVQGKSVWKGFKIYTYKFLGMTNCNALCENLVRQVLFFSYSGFSVILDRNVWFWNVV